MATVTIPKKMTRGDELVIIPRSEYQKFLALAEEKSGAKVTEADIARWSREAKKMRRAGILPKLRSLKDFG